MHGGRVRLPHVYAASCDDGLAHRACTADVQAEIYDRCGACLANRIAPETFHITLHDLLNAPGRQPEHMDETRFWQDAKYEEEKNESDR